MAGPWQICDKTMVDAHLLKIPWVPRKISGTVIDLSLPEPVDAMTVPSNRTASGFAAPLRARATRRQEESWVVFVQ
jgi:hypothetical protein